MADPYPKSRQLARGERRYRRKVASPKQWAAIRAEKLEGQPCRLHAYLGTDTYSTCSGRLEAHHLIARARGGNDEAGNIVPLCQWHHDAVTLNHLRERERLAAALTDAEYAYVVGKLGKGAMGRLFGV